MAARFFELVDSGKAAAIPRSPRLNASPARTTKKTKVGCETRVTSCLLLKFLRIRSKNFRYLLDRVPIARGDRHTQLLLDLAEIADCFHLSTIQTQDESVFDHNDL